MASVPQKRYTVEEYLALEERSEFRSEYFRGEIFAMSGGTPNHNRIARNILSRLHAQLSATGDCEAFGSDQQILIRSSQLYTYADVVVACGERQFDRNALINPRVIVEVLSKSTESYDRGDKFKHYRTLRSLKEYVLVSQSELSLERYVLQPDGDWRLSFYRELAAVVDLETIGARLTLAEVYLGVELIYEGVDFTPPQ